MLNRVQFSPAFHVCPLGQASADTTVAPSIGRYISVGLVVGMASRAVALPGIDGGRRDPPQRVRPVGCKLQMVGVDACPIATDMVNLNTRVNGSVPHLPKESMNTHHRNARGFGFDQPVARVMKGTTPDPTLARLAWSDVAPDAFTQRNWFRWH